MYAKFFGLQQEPFSIAPDPRYLFMSERHRDALAHLLYGLRGGGGFVLLSGEIGAGKTTVCRCFLEQIPEHCHVAYIFNPRLTVHELLRTVCEEYGIQTPAPAAGGETVKQYLDPLNEFLLKTHALGHNTVLIIDEAQQLSAEVLEQLRLLTNLETNERKLLQIILIGQPELRAMLARPELEQLAQRVIARFHLEALSEAETAQYVRHRLGVAGFSGKLPFDRRALRRIHRLSRGVPRRINLLCDRALLGAYARQRPQVDAAMLARAAAEVFEPTRPAGAGHRRRWALAAGSTLVATAAIAMLVNRGPALMPAASPPVPMPTRAPAPAPAPAPQQATQPQDDFPTGLRSESEAWRELAALWQPATPLPAGEPCEALQREQQLQCFRSEAGLALLRLLDRPSLLTLYDGQGQVFYATLVQLDTQGLTLRAGSQTRRLSLLALGRHWRGEFATLWRTPPGYQGRISGGPALQWLDEQLALALGQPEPLGAASRHDPALEARVAAFQRTQGLKSDGRAGPITLMQLNRASGLAEPRLQEAPKGATRS